MDERSEKSSIISTLSLNDFNKSSRVGISQSSFDKFNKAMLQLQSTNVINAKKIEEKKHVLPSQCTQQLCANDNNPLSYKTNNKHKRISLNMINIQSNKLSEYKYVAPRPPRYIRCLNSNIKTSQYKSYNLSKSLPIYTKDDNLFSKKSDLNSTNIADYTETNQQNLVYFGDPSNCYSKKVVFHRTPSQPLRMKIKSRAKDSESLSNRQLNQRMANDEHKIEQIKILDKINSFYVYT